MAETPREDLGGLLRRARQRHGLTLRQLSARTKIPVTVLQAMERNDIRSIPSGIFGRGFVRSYASEVGLDPSRTLDLFLDTFPDRRRQELGGQRAGIGTPAVTGGRRWPAVIGIVTVLLVACAGLVAVVLVTRDGLGRRTTAEPPPALRVSSPPATVDAPTTRPLTIEIHPSRDCYVAVTVDGRRVLSRLVRAGERLSHDVRERVVLEVDDAGAFAFSINRQRGRVLGGAGERITLVIDHDNYRRYLVR